mgnify:CR=1 FL=1
MNRILIIICAILTFLNCEKPEKKYISLKIEKTSENLFRKSF